MLRTSVRDIARAVSLTFDQGRCTPNAFSSIRILRFLVVTRLFGWMILALGAVIGAGIWAKEFFTGKGDDDDSSQDESKDKAA